MDRLVYSRNPDADPYPGNGGLNISYGLSPHLNEMWATKFAAHDIWARGALEKTW